MFHSDFDKAVEFHNAGKFTEALVLYKKILAINPTNLSALNNSACIKDELGDITGAFEDINRAIQISPKYADAHYNRGYLYKKCKSYEMAIQDYTKAIELGVSNIAYSFHGRGKCYEELGLLDKALEDISKSIDIYPKYPSNVYNRARIYVKKEAYELAYNDYLYAIELQYPEYDPQELVTLINRSNLEDGLSAARRLINAGFYVSFYGNNKKKVVVTPRIGDRIVLALHELHIGKTIKRHLKKMENRYELCFDYDINPIIDGIKKHYQVENDTYLPTLCHYLTVMNRSTDSPRAVGVGLLKDGKLAAGEAGVMTGKVYTSYSGYHDEDNAGTVQLILLAQFLKERGFLYFDFGPETDMDSYKMRLGAAKMTTEEYLSLFASI